jgi:hypothetical protein
MFEQRAQASKKMADVYYAKSKQAEAEGKTNNEIFALRTKANNCYKAQKENLEKASVAPISWKK